MEKWSITMLIIISKKLGIYGIFLESIPDIYEYL